MNQCKGIVNIPQQEVQQIFSDEEFLNVLEGFYFGMRYPKVAKMKCKVPCTITRPNIILKYSENVGRKDVAQLASQFDNLVIQRTKVLMVCMKTLWKPSIESSSLRGHLG